MTVMMTVEKFLTFLKIISFFRNKHLKIYKVLKFKINQYKAVLKRVVLWFKKKNKMRKILLKRKKSKKKEKQDKDLKRISSP